LLPEMAGNYIRHRFERLLAWLRVPAETVPLHRRVIILR
jgi:hypothetical protein